MHAHGTHQLVYASAGVLTVAVAAGCWVVPPQRAVWVPAGTQHEVRTHGATRMRTLYLRRDIEPRGIAGARVVAVSALLRELILELVHRDPADPGPRAHLEMVLVDQLTALDAAPLELPTLTEPRLVALACGLQADPGDNRTLHAWARALGTSERTLNRLFAREARMTFRQWRRQLRLHEALKLLAGGMPVTGVAHACGYANSSAFIATFRDALGLTPGRYFGPRTGGAEPSV